MLLSDAGGGDNVVAFTLGFKAGVPVAPEFGPLDPGTSSATYRPTNYGTAMDFFADSYPVRMSVFEGIKPNGLWQLYVIDDFIGDSGGIDGGWSLRITTKQRR